MVDRTSEVASVGDRVKSVKGSCLDNSDARKRMDEQAGMVEGEEGGSGKGCELTLPARARGGHKPRLLPHLSPLWPLKSK